MPRRLRPQVAGIPVHIIKRGNNRQACFYAEADYQFFLHHLGGLAKRFECEVHAYVLMTNHFHLLLTPYLWESMGSEPRGNPAITAIQNKWGQTPLKE